MYYISWVRFIGVGYVWYSLYLSSCEVMLNKINSGLPLWDASFLTGPSDFHATEQSIYLIPCKAMVVSYCHGYYLSIFDLVRVPQLQQLTALSRMYYWLILEWWWGWDDMDGEDWEYHTKRTWSSSWFNISKTCVQMIHHTDIYGIPHKHRW